MIALNRESRIMQTANQTRLFPMAGISINEAPAGQNRDMEFVTTTRRVVALGSPQHGSNDIAATPGDLKKCDPFRKEKMQNGSLKGKACLKSDDQEEPDKKEQPPGQEQEEIEDQLDDLFDPCLSESESSEHYSSQSAMLQLDTASVWNPRNKKYLDVKVEQVESLGDEEREDYWTLGESCSEAAFVSLFTGEEDCPPILEENMENEDPTEASTYSYLDSITIDSVSAAKLTYKTTQEDTDTPKSVTTYLESPKMRRRRILEESLRKMVDSSPKPASSNSGEELPSDAKACAAMPRLPSVKPVQQEPEWMNVKLSPRKWPEGSKKIGWERPGWLTECTLKSTAMKETPTKPSIQWEKPEWTKGPRSILKPTSSANNSETSKN